MSVLDYIYTQYIMLKSTTNSKRNIKNNDIEMNGNKENQPEFCCEHEPLNKSQNISNSNSSNKRDKCNSQIIAGTSNQTFIQDSQNLEKSDSRASRILCKCCYSTDDDGLEKFCFGLFKNYEALEAFFVKLHIAEILFVIFIWLCIYSVIGNEMLPGGHLFALLILIICCIVGGKLVSFLKLPPLLGMLLVGFSLRNIPVINVASDLNQKWASSLRSIALVVILIRAGLGLDPDALKRLSFVCFRLAFSPCLIETLTVSIASHLLLGLPWLWGFMLGFVLSAVSPAVVVPSMIAIQEKGLGREKGIPTLIIAAASIDDVLAISGFGVVLGITFTEGSVAWTIAKGPIEVVLGLFYGVIVGVILWFIPTGTNESKVAYRLLLLLAGGIISVFGSRIASFGGAGALGCLVLSFVAAFGWRKQGWHDESNPVAEHFSKLWFIFQPILFGLIGAEISVDQLDSATIGYGIVVLCIGMVFRIATSFLVVAGANLNLKERFFVALAWLPKATVQAAIGPVALDYARQHTDPNLTHYGLQVLTISVLVIILTAPLGAVAISLSAPKLLKSTSNDEEKDIQTV